MNAHAVALRRGKAGPVQSFSTARLANPGANAQLRGTLCGDLSPAIRSQILADPGNVHQFAGVFGESVGYFTRPVLALDAAGTHWFVGSFTDTIGEPHPAKVGVPEFTSFFTTIVRRADALALGLAIHPAAPDTLEGRRNGGVALAASMDRLNFPMPDNPVDGDFPVVVALPAFFPMEAGKSFPHLFRLDDALSYRDTYLAFEVWRCGWQYILANNEGKSVTRSGPLFHLPQFNLGAGIADPFVNLTISGPDAPTMTASLMTPTAGLFAQVRAQLLAWSDTIWAELGSTMAPEPDAPAAAAVAPGGGGFTLEQFGVVMDRFAPKEKTFAQAGRTAARYKLLLAGEPADGNDCATLPEMSAAFNTYLSIPNSATAAEELKELFKSRLTIANDSTLASEKDVTLEPSNMTVAFSDRVRTYGLLTDKLVTVSLTGAQNQLGLIHFLTPDRTALALVAACDQGAATLLMSNSTSSTAMLDASKSSKLYCGGRLQSFRHVYEAVCNFRCFLSVAVEDLVSPMVVKKLLEYVALLQGRDGRGFFESYRNTPHLAVHPYQDCQSIYSAFARVGSESTLYGAVGLGQPISWANYRGAIDVADALIADLRAIINGNGLGKFAGVPTCALWFSAMSLATPSKDAAAGGAHGESKRQRTSGTPPKVVTAEETERRKKLGLLVFNPVEAGSTTLPNCSVYHKRAGARSPERLCLNFMTRGYSCGHSDCKLAHIVHLGNLGPAEQTKLSEFVRKQKGMSWAPDRGPAIPAGTTG